MTQSLIIMAAGRARRYGGVKPLAPVGLNGEAVIDLIASDAVAGGFTEIVVVINSETGPLIAEHIKGHWPARVNVRFAVQERPLGTVHAVLQARHLLDHSQSFGVANADDLYGRPAMLTLGEHVRKMGTNALIGFRLDHALVGDLPVTRGVCDVHEGFLRRIAERRNVQLTSEGFVSTDGIEPRTLSADTRVSMNLWAFESAMWEVFESAMMSANASEDSEVLLPDIIGGLLVRNDAAFAVLPSGSRCVGVTHASDLGLVQRDIRDQVARGERPATTF